MNRKELRLGWESEGENIVREKKKTKENEYERSETRREE